MYRAYFVDDEPLVLEELSSHPLLAECGFQAVGSSTNPFIAEKEIKKLNPDVVFADLRMPQRSGVDLMAELRERGADCEFVVISAYPEFEEARRFFLMGGVDYLLKPVANEHLQRILNKLAAKLAGKGQRKDTPSPELNLMVAYLGENVSEKHSLDSLGEKFKVNPTYISKLFASHLGTTFNAYLTKLRMEEAAKLLRDTPKDVNEISRLCGYDDYFYFCRVFRRHHACTPTGYREAAK